MKAKWVLSMSQNGFKVGKKWVLMHFDPLLDGPKRGVLGGVQKVYVLSLSLKGVCTGACARKRPALCKLLGVSQNAACIEQAFGESSPELSGSLYRGC